MKKLLLSLSLSAVTLFAVANPPKNKNKSRDEYMYEASKSLHNLYGTVENLKWSKAKDHLIRADFKIDGEQYSSFFSQTGDFVATTNEITMEKLPALVRNVVKNKFDDKKIENMVHYVSDSENAYFIEMEDKGKRKVFKISSSGGISRFS